MTSKERFRLKCWAFSFILYGSVRTGPKFTESHIIKIKGVVGMFVAGFIVGVIGAGTLCTLIVISNKKRK